MQSTPRIIRLKNEHKRNFTIVSKKLSKSQKAKKASLVQQPGLSRRKFIGLSAAAAAIGTTAFGLNALEVNKRELHDLTVIGNGKPTVVQIHDPSCPICRRLKKIMSNAVGGDDRVQYRLADITTAEGKSLQEKHSVPHVTVLYFDGKGKHVHTTQGIQEADAVKAVVQDLFGSPS